MTSTDIRAVMVSIAAETKVVTEMSVVNISFISLREFK
jgi:hypothetical protein